MTDDAHRAILRQIVGEGRVAMPGGTAAGAGSDGSLALRLETARSVREDFGLTAVVESCTALRPRLEDLEDEVTPDRLSVLLRGAEGRLGLAVFSPDLALALLEWRLVGVLMPEPPEPRPLTATDAAILADLTDPLLARFGAAMATRPGCDWAQGYVQGARLEDRRHLPLVLAPGGYHGFRVTLRLGDGGRGGDLFLALPESHAPAPPKPSDADRRPWPEALQVGVLGAELVLNAVLWRMRLSAAAVAGLRPGDVLALPAAALTAVRLEAPGRVTVAEGRLGQCNGDRAVKIVGTDAALPDLPPAMEGPGLAAPAAPGLPEPMAMAAPMPPEEGMAGVDTSGEEPDFPAIAGLGEDDGIDPDAAFVPQSADFGADLPALSDP